MKELITYEQASWLMRIVLVAAPIIGLAWGYAAKKVKVGLIVGLMVGVGNFLLWHMYNAITERLGLDTVANFVANLFLFVFLGLVAGVVYGFWAKQNASNSEDEPDRPRA